MTRADIEKNIADEHYKLADLYLQLANDSSAPVRADAVEAGSALPPSAAFEASPFEPDEFPVTQPYKAPAPTEQDRILAECPVHFKPWTIKEGGMSKAGKPYSAFWKCSARNEDDSYCDKKPTKEWVKVHDPEKALAAA